MINTAAAATDNNALGDFHIFCFKLKLYLKCN